MYDGSGNNRITIPAHTCIRTTETYSHVCTNYHMIWQKCENDEEDAEQRVTWRNVLYPVHITSTVATINVCMCTVFYFQFANNIASKSMATFNPCDIRNEQCTLTICQNQPISHCAWHHQHKYSHFVDNFTQLLSIPRFGHFALSFWCLFVQLIITFSYIEIGLDSVLVCVAIFRLDASMLTSSYYMCNS